jgi:hypothetical protein
VRLFKGISMLCFTDMYADLLLNKATCVKSDYSPHDLNGTAGERNRPPMKILMAQPHLSDTSWARVARTGVSVSMLL